MLGDAAADRDPRVTISRPLPGLRQDADGRGLIQAVTISLPLPGLRQDADGRRLIRAWLALG